MQRTSDFLAVETAYRSKSVEDLAAIRETVERLREELLDYNPVLAIIADALQKAVELELESHRCDLRIKPERV